MNYGFVYETTNLINGKKYIGKHKRTQDINDPDDSWYLGSGKHLLRAVDKYGSENFSRIILCECTSEDDLQEKEKFYIDKYNAVDDPTYYNLVHDANPPILQGEDHPMKDPQVAQKVSKALRGRHLTEEHKKHLSETMINKGIWSGDNNPTHINPPIGNKNPFYGKHHSDEVREQLSRYAKERVGEKSPRHGAKLSENSKLKISKTLTGYRHTEEAKQNMKIARANQKVKRVCRVCNEEFIANSAAAKYCPKCKERRF